MIGNNKLFARKLQFLKDRFNRFIDSSVIINKSLIIIFQMNPQRNETIESCSDRLQLAAAPRWPCHSVESYYVISSRNPLPFDQLFLRVTVVLLWPFPFTWLRDTRLFPCSNCSIRYDDLATFLPLQFLKGKNRN